MRALRPVGRCHQDDEIRFLRGGDEALGAVDHVVIAVAHGGGAHRTGIGAGVRLGLREAALALAADGRQEVTLAHLAFERIERGAHVGAENAHAARRECDGAADLRPHYRARKLSEALAAIFLRHVDLPEAERLAAFDEMRLDLGLELGAVERFAFERDQFVVDKAPHHVAERTQLFREVKLGDVHLATASDARSPSP